MLQQSVGGQASPLKNGKRGHQLLLSEDLGSCVTAGADVKGNCSLAGPKAMHPLIKLYNGTGSVDTFLTKFRHMAKYLRWDNEDVSPSHASLEGAAGQVL